jgi:hypothetical protein
MPNPHHRKKHKHFQPPPHVRKEDKKGAAGILAIFGGIVGLAITFFAAQASLLWMVVGTVAGIVTGYFAGTLIDKPSTRKK